MKVIDSYWNSPSLVSFRKNDAYPYARGLIAVSGLALAVSCAALTLFAAGPLLLSLSKASFTIAEWSFIGAAAVTAGCFIKGYLERFFTLVQAKIESIVNNKR
ncbi:MAG: hypothetical protein ACK4HV_04295 [Parachlamydiaceae bacterium]